MQEQDEDEPAEEDHDHERRHGAERVHVVRARKPRAAPQRVTEAAPLDEGRRRAERDEREERERDDVEAGNDRDPLHDQREEGDERDRERDEWRATVGAERQAAGRDVRRSPDRSADAWDERPRERARKLGERGSRERGPDAERERRPEPQPVEAQCLGDDLADGARLRRERRR